MSDLLKSRDLYILFGLYLITNIFLLINIDGLYWDDWAAYKQSPETMKIFFAEIQHGIKGDFFLFLSRFYNGIYSFRLFIFFGTFLMGIFVYLILSTIKELDKQAIFFITLLFLIVPVNSVKLLISIAPFVFPVLIFYLAFYLLALYTKHHNLLLRLLILALFFTSFSTNSILVFYFSIFIYLYYINFNFTHDKLLHKSKLLLKQYWDFFILPFIYFIYKAVYLKPYGLYEGYNGIGISSLWKAPVLVIKSFFTSLINPVEASFILIGIAPSFILLYIVHKAYKKWLTKTTMSTNLSQTNKTLLIVGFLIFILAVLPYCMVGKLPNYKHFDSRFQLLTPLGISFILYFSINYFAEKFKFSNHLKLSILATLTILFMTKTMYDGYRFNIDWFYSVGIQENMREMEVIKNNTTFITVEDSKQYLANHRDIPYYEYNGMLKQVFGDDKRFASESIEQINSYSKFKDYPQYNFSSWVPSEPIYLSIVFSSISDRDLVRLFYYKFSDDIKFKEYSKKIIKIYEVKAK